MKVRTNTPLFLGKVEAYYKELFRRIAPLQATCGGPVIMMQVENEYGSYAEDKAYMRSIAQMMKVRGVTVPLFTSDGTWIEALESGTLIEDDIFVTGNFGSQPKENTDNLRAFMERYGKEWPLMCTEFWDGWFSRWSEEIVRREAEDLAQDVKEMLQLGSMNLFLLRGGTNFGFISGCSARKTKDLPQITSYDFDAPITEWGQPTEKYYAVQRVTHEVFPEFEQMEPISRQAKAYGSFPLLGTANLLDVAADITEEILLDYPQPMEQIGQNHGYILYRSDIKNQYHEERLKALETHDRCHFYINQEHLATQYREEIGDEMLFSADTERIQIDVLVENMGRVNFGPRMEHQRKGIGQCVQVNGHMHNHWKQYTLPLDNIEKVDFSKEYKEGLPGFYRFTVDIDETADTFLDFEGWGKGCVFVNGFNIGRFWEIGPQKRLYIPAPLLKKGENEIIVFETEGKTRDTIVLKDEPDIG